MAEQKVEKLELSRGESFVSMVGGYTDLKGKKASVSVSGDGKVSVEWSKDVNRPNAGGYYDKPVLIGSGKVDFPDDSTFSFTFDGSVIRWDNNTQWTKEKIDGKWVDEKGVGITVTSYPDGELKIVWDNDRPDAYGNINERANTGWVRFPDDKKWSLLFTGNQVAWSNNTKWTKKE